MNRRNFLKLSGAVALVAALPALPSVPLAPRAYARHATIRLRDGQVVEGCTFQRGVMFVGPAQNVLIRDCTFSGGDMVLGFDVTNFLIRNCTFFGCGSRFVDDPVQATVDAWSNRAWK